MLADLHGRLDVFARRRISDDWTAEAEAESLAPFFSDFR